jgi:hypothetical protein
VSNLDSQLFNIASNIMKYIFILLILIIFYRTLKDVIAEYRETKRSKKNTYFAPIGYMEIMQCEEERLVGEIYPIKRECYIGKSSFCDIRLKLPGFSNTECYLYAKGSFVFIRNMGSEYGVFVDGVELTEDLPVRNGTLLSFIGVEARVQLKEVESGAY